MNRLTAVLLAVLTASTCLLAEGRRYRVMTYNVENLFDTCHDNGKSDEEFLPDGERKWNSWRYWKKLGDLARVVAAAGGDEPASLVALCEVENDSVVRDLARRTMLRRLGYEYIVTRGPDARGIDVALLYQPGRFRPVGIRSVRVAYTSPTERPTRDILYVEGLVPTGDTLDVFVCHFPSRSGGAARSEAYRCRAAATLRRLCDSLFRTRSEARLLIMGDFNDEYRNKSLRRCLRALPPPDERGARAVGPDSLYVLTARKQAGRGIRGTYRHKGRWNQLDQIVVNGRLLMADEGMHTSYADCQIVTLDYLLEPDATNGGVRPRRTYQGPIYRGGVSDHLPVVADFFY